MRLKKCAKCGKLFNTAKNEQTLCDECVATAKSTTIRPRPGRSVLPQLPGHPAKRKRQAVQAKWTDQTSGQY